MARAQAAAAALADGHLLVSGAANAVAAGKGEVLIVAVPWCGHRELLRELSVLGDDRDAVQGVIGLAGRIPGMRGATRAGCAAPGRWRP